MDAECTPIASTGTCSITRPRGGPGTPLSPVSANPVRGPRQRVLTQEAEALLVAAERGAADHHDGAAACSFVSTEFLYSSR